MSYLIDTHTLLWYFKGDLQLSKTANEILEDGKKQKYVSMASLWEIAIKVNIERLQLDYPFADIEHKLKFENIGILNISFLHTQHVLNLPLHHRDPFDRMIIAQGITEGLTIISKDKNFSLYPIKLLW
jgi:PIN domain nuclease of toxin-antitoxin system